jgi:hypothetical protein
MFSENPIIGIKLVSGEEIISHARFNKLERAWHLQFPGMLVPMTSASGKPSIGVGDYLPFTQNKEITLREDCVMFTYIPDNEMITGYKNNFDSEDLPDTENVLPFTRK